MSKLFSSLFSGLAAKFVPSILRGLVAIAIAALSAIAGLDPGAILAGAHVAAPTFIVVGIWGFIVTVIHSLVASLQHAVATSTGAANANVVPAAPVK